jgi:hypothetical protein
MKDVFGADISVGTLVTYAMKQPGINSIIHPVCTIVSVDEPNGRVQLKIDKAWLSKWNVHFLSSPTLMVTEKIRSVSLGSIIRIDTHPSFKQQEL